MKSCFNEDDALMLLNDITITEEDYSDNELTDLEKRKLTAAILSKVKTKSSKSFSIPKWFIQAAAVCLVVVITFSMPILGRYLIHKKSVASETPKAELQYIYPVDKAIEEYANKVFKAYAVEEVGNVDIHLLGISLLNNSDDHHTFNLVRVSELTQGTNPRAISYLVDTKTSEVYCFSPNMNIKCNDDTPGIPIDYIKDNLIDITLPTKTIYYDLKGDGKKEEIQFDPTKNILTVDGISNFTFFGGVDPKIDILNEDEIKQQVGIDKSYGCTICIKISIDDKNNYFFYKDDRIVGMHTYSFNYFNPSTPYGPENFK